MQQHQDVPVEDEPTKFSELAKSRAPPPPPPPPRPPIAVDFDDLFGDGPPAYLRQNLDQTHTIPIQTFSESPPPPPMPISKKEDSIAVPLGEHVVSKPRLFEDDEEEEDEGLIF